MTIEEKLHVGVVKNIEVAISFLEDVIADEHTDTEVADSLQTIIENLQEQIDEIMTLY